MYMCVCKSIFNDLTISFLIKKIWGTVYRYFW